MGRASSRPETPPAAAHAEVAERLVASGDADYRVLQEGYWPNRERVLDACMADGLRAFLPSRAMCTDNAAMVAAAGWWRLQQDGPSPLDVGASPNLRLV